MPSHCALLNDASEKLQNAFKEIKLSRPKIAYLSSSTCRVLWDPEVIKTDLFRNMARSTHWHDTMVAARERGVTAVLEMPPGNVLTKLTQSVLFDNYAAALSATPMDDIIFRLEAAVAQL